METKLLTHILCDLSDVLIKGLEGVEIPLSQKLNKQVENIKDILFNLDYTPLWNGEVQDIPFFKKVIMENKWTITIDEFLQLVYDNFTEISGVREIYQCLSKRYILVLGSVNTEKWVNNLEKKYNFESLFYKCYYSYDLKCTKRTPDFVQYILSDLDILPENLFMIDDSTRNLTVAKSLNVQGIKFLNSTQLRNELNKINLL